VRTSNRAITESLERLIVRLSRLKVDERRRVARRLAQEGLLRVGRRAEKEGREKKLGLGRIFLFLSLAGRGIRTSMRRGRQGGPQGEAPSLSQRSDEP
jgi:hypothetical protein